MELMSRKIYLKVLFAFVILIGLYNCKSNIQADRGKPNEIIKGIDANEGEIPWQIGLYKKGSTPAESCFGGGAILNENWIITAAHCFKFMKRDTLRVRKVEDVIVFAGATDLNSSNAVKINIEEIIIHGEYSPSKRFNDIALIKLATPLDLSQRNLSKIKLPYLTEYIRYTEKGRELTVSGWGIVDVSTTESSTILQKGNVPVVKNQKCRENYLQRNEIVSSEMLCAGYNYGKVDACGGDSGGPLFAIDNNNIPILIGIVSWGIGCAQKGLYGVYTNVNLYKPWIEENCPDYPFDYLN